MSKPECPCFTPPRVDGTEAHFWSSLCSVAFRIGNESVYTASSVGWGKLSMETLSNDVMMVLLCVIGGRRLREVKLSLLVYLE